MAHLNVTVLIPMSQTPPLDENPTDAFLTPDHHLEGADEDVMDAAWGRSEMRRLQVKE